jgi:anti-anti-sigma regulatory factor
MNVTISQAQGRVPVTVLHIQGDLDASSYRDLIAKGQEVYDAGTRDILLDLGDMSFISSSGIVALHVVSLIVRGEKPSDPELGWEAFRAIGRDRDVGLQQHVKLLNPQDQADKVLETVGFKQFFEIHSDLETAVASF